MLLSRPKPTSSPPQRSTEPVSWPGSGRAVSKESSSTPSGPGPRVFGSCPGSSPVAGRQHVLRSRIIPCLDVSGGRVVKGVNFVDLVDAGDPTELARRYAEEGADEICFLDISATPEDRGTTLDVVRRTASNVFVPLTVGGGVRSPEDMKAVLRAGAGKVSEIGRAHV